MASSCAGVNPNPNPNPNPNTPGSLRMASSCVGLKLETARLFAPAFSCLVRVRARVRARVRVRVRVRQEAALKSSKARHCARMQLSS
eukprot:scaffold72187_cov53-Phaeocystis_antarctica.AAC.3